MLVPNARNGKLFATIFIPLIKIKIFIIIICVQCAVCSVDRSLCVSFEINNIKTCVCVFRWFVFFLRFSFHSSNWTSMNQVVNSILSQPRLFAWFVKWNDISISSKTLTFQYYDKHKRWWIRRRWWWKKKQTFAYNTWFGSSWFLHLTR